MIAHAYAAQHPDHTRSVMWGECPLPGSTPYESGFKTSPGMWHFTFQQQNDCKYMFLVQIHRPSRDSALKWHTKAEAPSLSSTQDDTSGHLGTKSTGIKLTK